MERKPIYKPNKKTSQLPASSDYNLYLKNNIIYIIWSLILTLFIMLIDELIMI